VGKAYSILRGDVHAMNETAATQKRSVDPELWGERASELAAASASGAQLGDLAGVEHVISCEARARGCGGEGGRHLIVE